MVAVRKHLRWANGQNENNSDLSSLGNCERNSAKPKARKGRASGSERVHELQRGDGGFWCPCASTFSVDELMGPVSQSRCSSPDRRGCQPWAEGFVSRRERVFPDRESLFPNREEKVPHREKPFPGQASAFPGQANKLPRREATFPRPEQLFPEREKTIPSLERLFPDPENRSALLVFDENHRKTPNNGPRHPRDRNNCRAEAGAAHEQRVTAQPQSSLVSATSLFVEKPMMSSNSVRSDMLVVRKDYAAPTGLENFVGGSATKISLLT